MSSPSQSTSVQSELFHNSICLTSMRNVIIFYLHFIHLLSFISCKQPKRELNGIRVSIPVAFVKVLCVVKPNMDTTMQGFHLEHVISRETIYCFTWYSCCYTIQLWTGSIDVSRYWSGLWILTVLCHISNAEGSEGTQRHHLSVFKYDVWLSCMLLVVAYYTNASVTMLTSARFHLHIYICILFSGSVKRNLPQLKSWRLIS